MESCSSSSAPSCDLAGYKVEYDVFLSSRDSDTRDFADSLYHSLINCGLRVFRDRDLKLLPGEDYRNALFERKKQSKVLIPVFSRDYASAPNCILELVQIFECWKTRGRAIVPIFYDFNPSDLRNQSSVQESFLELEKKGVNSQTIEKWKLALQVIASAPGFETRKAHERPPDFMDALIALVQRNLKPSYDALEENEYKLVANTEHVIGIEDQVKKVIELLEIKNDEVKVGIAIHGTSGIGKTTIAKAVYDQLSSCFDSCSFLAEIGETAKNDGGFPRVQTKLISDILKRDGDFASFEGGIKFFRKLFAKKKALIVLDDVEEESYLDNLVGPRLDWFGSGSRIIVTTENPEILQNYGSQMVDDSQVIVRSHEVNEMDKNFALELFYKHALGTEGSTPGYREIGERIVQATGQVPFIIEVIGSLLRGKKENEWTDMEDLIKAQEENSRKECQEISKTCYKALDEMQKQAFWDIAWFANGVDSRIASYMWPDRYLLPSHHVLMPLAKIGEDNILRMHKLSKRLSETIDQEKTKYMRVTDPEVIRGKEGMEEVEVLCFDFKSPHPHITETHLKSMPNIRFLKLDHAKMTGNFTNVFPKLRWLRWQGCPRKFEAAEFSLTALFILDLSWSKVTEDWEGWKKIKMEQLKVLNLTGCTDLLISPKFSSFPNLEILILERCSRLVHLDPSVSDLKKLLCLNLKSCTELHRLPAELSALKALKELLIDETSVGAIPLGSDSEKVEHLTSLSILSADNSKITKLPNGVGVKLRHLSLRNCHWIRKLPEFIGPSGSPLEELDISGTGISELPESFVNLQRLRVLKMDHCFISRFPSFIWHLQILEELHAASCRNLVGEIPGDIGNLKNLRILRLRNSAITKLPPEIEHLPKLETLDVLHCDMLDELPALPSSLVIMHFSPTEAQRERLRLRTAEESAARTAFKDGKVIPIHSRDELYSKLSAASRTSRLAILFFTAEWCWPSRSISPLFDSLAAKYPKVVFLKVNVDEVKNLPTSWGIDGIPIFSIRRDGGEVDKLVGADKDKLEKMIAQNVA